jgi:hypothetical protein
MRLFAAKELSRFAPFIHPFVYAIYAVGDRFGVRWRECAIESYCGGCYSSTTATDE